MRLIGARVPRVEDQRILTGRGHYIDDLQLPGMLHLAFAAGLRVSELVALPLFATSTQLPDAATPTLFDCRIQPSCAAGHDSVNVLPLDTAVVVAMLTEHWLFCNVVAAPGVAACQAVAPSLSKFNWLLDGW